MITAIEIENFKCIGERVRIELAPITLLFGPNSAGKSTIIEALLYFFEILERGNVDAHETLKGGKTVDLGGFRNLVFMRDLRRSIKIRVEFAGRLDSIPDTWGSDYELFGEEDDPLGVLAQTLDAWIDIEIRWSHILQRPSIRRYEVGLNGEMVGAIVASDDEKRIEIAEANPRHEMFDVNPSIEMLRKFDEHWGELAGSGNEGPRGLIEQVSALETRFNPEQRLEFERRLGAANIPQSISLTDKDDGFSAKEKWQYAMVAWNVLGEEGLLERKTESSGSDQTHAPRAPEIVLWLDGKIDRTCIISASTFSIPVFTWKGALPGLDISLKIARYLSTSPEEKEKTDRILSHIFVSPGRYLRDSLRKLKFLGPLRDMPSRRFAAPGFPGDGRWASGLGAWDQLWLGPPELCQEVSAWLAPEERLGAGYSIEKRQVKIFDADHPALAVSGEDDPTLDHDESWAAMVSETPTETDLILVDQQSMLPHRPHDVGTGISQILPVVVAAVDEGGGLTCIEQPELHIHPRLQTSLGDLFISQIQDGEKQFLLETHSEHLLLRLLRRIRETSEDELAPGLWPIKPDQLSVNYLESGSAGTTVRQLEVDEDGDFSGDWPEGFFQERKAELF